MSPAEDVMPESEAAPKHTVLVVEDEILIRMSVADHLRACGLKVAEAGNAAEAQALFSSGLQIDLVFSDIHMPNPNDGVGLAQWIDAEGYDVPVILTSGIADALKAAEGACRNIRAFTQKPYDQDALVARIVGLLAPSA